MSGGEWGYMNDSLAAEIFGWGLDIDYGLNREKHKVAATAARKRDPLEDKELSELVFDVFCLLHSCDWYKSCDTGEDTYREDVKAFKKKWLGRTYKQRVMDEIEKSLAEVRGQLQRDLLCEPEGE